MDVDVAHLSPVEIAVEAALRAARVAGRAWAGVALAERLGVIGRARRLLARDCEALATLLADRRPVAETLVSEVLPLAAAASFLERRARSVLRTRSLWRGAPIWLIGVRSEVRREPWGAVLLLAPSNYPLFLPGTQALQALAAGNAVCVKPAPGCAAPMLHLAGLLREAGLPDGVLTVLGEQVETAEAAAKAGFDRIVLTGSSRTGRAVLRAAAETLTPATMELSGNDAMFVLPGADIDLAASCLAYGLRLNGSATCIAPRRVFVTRARAAALEAALQARIGGFAPATVPPRVLDQLTRLLREAETAGSRVAGQPTATGVPPIVVADARPGLALLREDVFAPVVSIVPVDDMDQASRVAAECPYALGASIFGPRREAEAFAVSVRAGSVVINDVIVPTADPRLPFGGRGESGFGVTRGAEGLLEMTTLKVVSVRRAGPRLHLAAPRPGDARNHALMIRLLYGGSIIRAFSRAVWRR